MQCFMECTKTQVGKCNASTIFILELCNIKQLLMLSSRCKKISCRMLPCPRHKMCRISEFLPRKWGHLSCTPVDLQSQAGMKSKSSSIMNHSDRVIVMKTHWKWQAYQNPTGSNGKCGMQKPLCWFRQFYFSSKCYTNLSFVMWINIFFKLHLNS